MKKIIIITTIIILLLTAIVYSQYDEDVTDDNPKDTDGTEMPSWYEVSEEEIKICENWGGVESIDSSTSGSVEGTDDVIDLTITLQGKKTVLYNTTLYEAGWYVQPLTGNIAYSIFFVEEDGDKEEIYDGFAEDTSGDANYEGLESDVVYTSVLLETETGYEMEVPFVEDE